MLIATGDSRDAALKGLAHKYGGKWKLSEKIGYYPSVKVKKLKTIIKANAVRFVPDPRVELGTPASSGQRSTDELARHEFRS
jgi:hypothetical protein